MDVFRGNIAADVYSLAYGSPMVLNNFTLVNRTGGNVTFGVYMMYNGQAVSIGQGTMNGSAMYTDELQRLIRQGEQIRLVTSGSTDYDFELDNTQAP